MSTIDPDFYPAGVKAPGIDGDFKDWIPGPAVAQPGIPTVIVEPDPIPAPVTEEEAVAEAMASMDGAVPYEKPVEKDTTRRGFLGLKRE